jgi:hypothetical protein
MYKSYHVRFVESHEATLTLDHIILPETPIIHEPSTIDEILQTASTEPLIYNKDDEVYLSSDQFLDPNPDPAPPVPDPAPVIPDSAPDRVH